MTHRSPHPIIVALRAARHTQGLSQEAIGLRIGVPAATVSTWETGQYTPALTSVAAYAEALGLTLTLTPKEDT